MSLLPTTLTGLPTMEEDSPQLLPPLLPRRDKDIFHTTMLNLLSRHMIKEMMPGLIIKLTRLTKLNGKLTSQLLEPIISILLKIHWNFQLLLFRERDKSIQSRTVNPTSHHIPKETTHGMMLSTTNPTRLPGVKRPTQPLLTTSTGSQMMEEDSPQLLHQLLLSKNGFHSMITNQLSLNMSKEMMLGQTIKQTNQMKLNGKLTFLPLVLIILTQLRPPQRPLLQMLTHLLLWFKRTALLIQ